MRLAREVAFSADGASVTLSTVNQFSGGGHVLAWARDGAARPPAWHFPDGAVIEKRHLPGLAFLACLVVVAFLKL